MPLQKIKFLTDSASDIPKDIAKKLDIQIEPILINVDGKDYQESVDFTPQKFYEVLLRAKALPVTAHISALQAAQYYKELYDQGYTDIIHVTINSKGSSTYEAAQLGMKFFYEDNPGAEEKMRIHLLDSLSYTLGYGYPIIESARMAKEGADVEQILVNLRDWFSRLEIYFCVSTLEFAKKSGRISCAAAFVGEVLGLRPVISIINGETQTVEKVRGVQKLSAALSKKSLERIDAKSPYTVIIGKNPEWGKEVGKQVEEALGYPPTGYYNAGASIAINAGPDLVGIAFKGKS